MTIMVSFFRSLHLLIALTDLGSFFTAGYHYALVHRSRLNVRRRAGRDAFLFLFGFLLFSILCYLDFIPANIISSFRSDLQIFHREGSRSIKSEAYENREGGEEGGEGRGREGAR